MAFLDEEMGRLSKREPPASISDCLKTDALSQMLWRWGQNIENWGRVILAVILICGAGVTIAIGIDFEFALSFVDPVLAILNSALGIFDEDTETMLTVMAVVSSVILFGLGAFIEYCVYHIISLVMCSLASIVQSNRISSDLAAYNAGLIKEDLNATSAVRYTIDDLGKLTKRKEQGLISAAEYEVKRNEIMRYL